MKRLNKLLLILFILTLNLTAQVVVSNPDFATENDSIVITFDATKATNTSLAGYTGDLYTHTGVKTDLGDWRYVIESWGNNITQPKLTRIGTDLYQLVIGYPREFYGVTSEEHILQLNFVFRSADANKKTEDIFLPLFHSGLNVSIIGPAERNLLVLINEKIDVVVKSVSSDSLFLYLDDTLLASTTSDSIGYTITVNNVDDHNIIAKAYSTHVGSVYDTVSYSVRGEVVVEELPEGVIDGINYIDDTTVTLSFFAPNKEFIYLIGDFNNWIPSSNYYMKRTLDGERYWITLTGLTPNVEYGFQYLVEGTHALADPYTEKVLEQEDDGIDNSTYPNLKSYPYGLVDGSVSIIENNKANYEWTSSEYQRPAKEKAVIYELLIRDFLDSHNYQTLIDTLDYLERLGINAIELMPVNEFEFNSSWGYNPSYYFAPDKYYGTENALKQFIDEAHKRNIAVLLDVVYNHTFGRSPFVRLYATGNYGPPSIDNYWHNVEATHPFNVGYDMNHESTNTRELIKRVLHHWITEYKVDGFRFDLSKGFTQTYSGSNVGLWGQKDDSRIAILKDYYDYTQTLDSDLYFILEHFADNSEETILANFGMMLWGNLNINYSQSAMGWIEYDSQLNYSSSLSWGYYKNRGWNDPNLVTYMESHDEQWLMFKNLAHGRSSGNYNVKDLNTALNRMKLVGTFFFTIPGPKMIWQFGELGYDEELTEEGRTDPKPIHWEYLDDPERQKLFKTFAALIKLRKENEVFTAKETNVSMDVGDGVFGRRINLTHPTMNATIIGNFNVVDLTMQPKFQNTGMWYDYFLGDSLNVTDVNMTIELDPGEFRIYTTKKLETPEEGITTDIKNSYTSLITDYSLMQNYPNPFNPTTTINFSIPNGGKVRLKIFDVLGREILSLVDEHLPAGTYSYKLNGNGLSSGVYFYRLTVGEFSAVKKLSLLK